MVEEDPMPYLPGEFIATEPCGVKKNGKELRALIKKKNGKYHMVLANRKGGPVLSGYDLSRLKWDFISGLLGGLYVEFLESMKEARSKGYSIEDPKTKEDFDLDLKFTV